MPVAAGVTVGVDGVGGVKCGDARLEPSEDSDGDSSPLSSATGTASDSPPAAGSGSGSMVEYISLASGQLTSSCRAGLLLRMSLAAAALLAAQPAAREDAGVHGVHSVPRSVHENPVADLAVLSR